MHVGFKNHEQGLKRAPDTVPIYTSRVSMHSGITRQSVSSPPRAVQVKTTIPSTQSLLLVTLREVEFVHQRTDNNDTSLFGSL